MSVFVILIIGIVLILAFAAWKFVHTKTLNDMPFEKKHFFFTAKQRAFYKALQEAAGDKYIVFPRIPMTAVVRTSRGLSKRKRAAYMKQLQGVQIPFVLCEASDLVIIAGVMLDEQLQQSEQSLIENHFITQAFKVIDLPLLSFSVAKTYDVKRMAKRLSQQIEEPQAEPVQDFLRDAGENTGETVVDLMLKPMDENSEAEPSQEQTCPKCGAPMMLKKAEKGRRAGKYFLMCSTFPKCKRAMPVESHEADANHQSVMVG